MRNKWLNLARRDPTAISPNSSIYFCEDHFDLQNDMLNYIQYHVMGTVSQVRMKPGCIPTKFECQPDRRKRTSTSVDRPYIIKKRRKMLVEECVMQGHIETKPVDLLDLNVLGERTPEVVSTVGFSVSSSDVKQEVDYSNDFEQRELGEADYNEMDTNMFQDIDGRVFDKKDKLSAKNNRPSTQFQLENHSIEEVYVKLELDETTLIKSEWTDNDEFVLAGDVKKESDFDQSDSLLGNSLVENKPETATCSPFDSETSNLSESDSEDRKSIIEQLIGEDGQVYKDEEKLSSDCRSLTTLKQEGTDIRSVEEVNYNISKETHECNYSSSRDDNLQIHIKRDHNKVNSSRYDWNPSSNVVLNYGIENARLELQNYDCCLCNYSAIKKIHLERHIAQNHLCLKNYKYQACDYGAKLKDELKRHIDAVHLKLKSFECQYCDYIAVGKMFLKQHV